MIHCPHRSLQKEVKACGHPIDSIPEDCYYALEQVLIRNAEQKGL